MAKTSYPKVGSSTTDAQYADLFNLIIGTGVRGAADLAVSADSTGLNVKIATGFAVVAGNAFNSTIIETLTIGANATGNARIDTIILKRDFSLAGGVVVDLVVKAGTASTTPVAPTLTQVTTGVWEEPLADVRVNNGVSTITSANVTDRRRYLPTNVMDWTTATRPAARRGLFGLNTTTGSWEGHDGTTWTNLSPTWANITGKPTTFPPSTHTHDDRYYTEAEMDSMLAGMPVAGHNHDDLYYREAEVDAKVDGLRSTLKAGTDVNYTAGRIGTTGNRVFISVADPGGTRQTGDVWIDY